MYECNDLFALSCSTATASTIDFNQASSSQFFDYSPPIYHHPLQHQSPPAPTSEYDSGYPVMKSELGYSSSSSSYGSPSSLPSYYAQQQRPSMVQRSLSSHSLLKDDGFLLHHHHHNHNHNHNHHPIYESRLSENFDLDLQSQGSSSSSSIRKVYSTGDLQGVNIGQSDSPLSNEASIIEGMNKVGRYSAEERKERIERYRSKRHQRNFNKKIKYACRKTLADSRPRIRGRFARNDEMEDSSQVQWNQMGIEENEEEDDLWVNLFDAFNMNLIP